MRGQKVETISYIIMEVTRSPRETLIKAILYIPSLVYSPAFLPYSVENAMLFIVTGSS